MAVPGPPGHGRDHDSRRQVLCPDPHRADRARRVSEREPGTARLAGSVSVTWRLGLASRVGLAGGFSGSVGLAARIDFAGRVRSCEHAPARRIGSGVRRGQRVNHGRALRGTERGANRIAAASLAPSPSPGASGAVVPGGSPAPSASPSTGDAIGLPTTGKLADLRFALEDKFGPIDEVRQEANIGPIISAEIAQQALLLIVLGSIGILAWVTFRFQDFRMGATAIAALVHDVLVVVGTFAIAGTFFGLQVDALFVTAMLTVIGFSVHDTIVVYDRIRENRIRHAGEPFDAIVNHSLLQTLGRSLNTSLTTVLVLTALAAVR